MRTSDFDYRLPEASIAQQPATPRDSSRLLVYSRASGETADRHFYDIGEYLHKGDVLVLNETKVIPARLFGVKRGGQARFEVLLLKRRTLVEWEVIMRPGKRLATGGHIDFAPGFSLELLEKGEGGVCRVRFFYEGVFENLLERYGSMPLPPYVTEELEDKSRYQTVYAQKDGSAAAPTAGLHFTPGLLASLEQKGVILARVLLHIGLGTFRPMQEENVKDHVMHSEWYSISRQAADTINRAKREGRRVVAVGTTCVRTLESAAAGGRVCAGEGETDIFIYPPYSFGIVDALLTNFHLPKSTLLMLVSAFAGRERVLALYEKAVRDGYRFFSLGDAMLIT